MPTLPSSFTNCLMIYMREGRGEANNEENGKQPAPNGLGWDGEEGGRWKKECGPKKETYPSTHPTS